MTIDLTAKRLFDVVVSAAGLVLLSPAFGVIAVLVRADSPGPAFFRQVRVGQNGVTFRIHKFRSLRSDSTGPLISSSLDQRVTRVGATLRRTKLDELPQLFDVVVGNMSLVGPRPEVPDYVALWPEEDRRTILSVRPGITDPASIVLRNEADELAGAADPQLHYVTSLLPRKVAMYVNYVHTRTFVGDLRILGETVATVLRE